jgi:hypothetical protein
MCKCFASIMQAHAGRLSHVICLCSLPLFVFCSILSSASNNHPASQPWTLQMKSRRCMTPRPRRRSHKATLTRARPSRSRRGPSLCTATSAEKKCNCSPLAVPLERVSQLPPQRFSYFLCCASHNTDPSALYVQMGAALPKGGPAGLFIAFLLWGSVMWAVNECFAEMVTLVPVPSPFVRFGGEWVDGALGFGMVCRGRSTTSAACSIY